LSGLVAKQALRQKKVYEQELESISGRKMTLTTQVCLVSLIYPTTCETDRRDSSHKQVNAIESANMNKETLEAMKKGAEVLKGIHGKLYVRTFSVHQDAPLIGRERIVYSNVDKVDATMDEVRNQLELTNEISQAISDPAGMGIDVSLNDFYIQIGQSLNVLGS